MRESTVAMHRTRPLLQLAPAEFTIALLDTDESALPAIYRSPHRLFNCPVYRVASGDFRKTTEGSAPVDTYSFSLFATEFSEKQPLRPGCNCFPMRPVYRQGGPQIPIPPRPRVQHPSRCPALRCGETRCESAGISKYWSPSLASTAAKDRWEIT